MPDDVKCMDSSIKLSRVLYKVQSNILQHGKKRRTLLVWVDNLELRDYDGKAKQTIGTLQSENEMLGKDLKNMTDSILQSYK